MSLPTPATDCLGRPQQDLHHLLTGIGGINWLAERAPNRKVPGAAWSLDVAPQTPLSRALEEDPEPMAVVACPCKEVISVPVLEAPIACECGRYYAFDTKDVWVFNSPFDHETPNDGPTPVAQ